MSDGKKELSIINNTAASVLIVLANMADDYAIQKVSACAALGKPDRRASPQKIEENMYVCVDYWAAPWQMDRKESILDRVEN